MENKNWKTDLKDLFEGIKVIELSKDETFKMFSEFREMVAEPAFELLSEEFKEYNVKSYYTKSKGNTIHFWISFPRPAQGSFHYTICLPKNSIELKLKLQLKANKTRKSPFVEREEEFMEYLSPADIPKVTKEELIKDFMKHCRNLKYELLTCTE